MGLLNGKTGIVMGVANDRSIAASVARDLHTQGAQLAFSHLPDQGERKRNEERLRQITKDLNPTLIYPCNVEDDAQIADFFSMIEQQVGRVDFIVHSIAFAPTEDIKRATIECSREGFLQAMSISVYSFLKICQHAMKLMNDGGAICTMSYYGGEKVMPGYNMMGLCKAALDHAVRYAAYELGEREIRVNAISAGPIRTLASSAVGDFKKSMQLYESVAPMRQNVSADDVAQACTYLLSDMARMITGEILHVDGGFNIMGGQPLSES